MQRISFAALALSAILSACGGAQTRAPSTGGSGAGVGASDAMEAPPARWLEGVHQGDVLTYRVTRPEQADTNVRLRVLRLVRRGASGVAAHLAPEGALPLDVSVTARWLAGDETGLYQMNEDGQLADPGFVPLDDAGRVVAEARAARIWRIPPEWRTAMQRSTGALVDGWSVDELELAIDGPVRGDRCATIHRREEEATVTRVLICANLGAVQVTRVRRDEIEEERWTLVEVGRSIQTDVQ